MARYPGLVPGGAPTLVNQESNFTFNVDGAASPAQTAGEIERMVRRVNREERRKAVGAHKQVKG